MIVLNRKLYKTIGITFSFKEFLNEYLKSLGDNDIVIDALTNSELDLFKLLCAKFEQCTPAMGFSAKQYVYEALEILVRGLIANASVSSDEAERLNRGLLKILRYVGIEGEEDFNFQQAIFFLCEVISSITGVHMPKGAVTAIQITDGGAGFDPDETGLIVDFDSAIPSSAVPGTIAVNTNSSGEIIPGLYSTADGGDGFYVGQVVILDTASSTSPAIGMVENIV